MTLHLDSRRADLERFFGGEAPREIVKQNSGRTVYRVAAGDPALYVKRFPRELLRDRAKHEAAMLRALEEAGLPCPRLVATARDREGSYVVTEEVVGAPVLKSLVVGGGHDVRRLLAAMAEVTRRMFDAKIDHGDWHVGNALVRDGRIWVLDVHRARRVACVTASRRREIVAFAAMSFRDSVPVTEMLRFIRRCGVTDHDAILDVWARLRRLQARYYDSRLDRCTVESTAFGVRDGIYYRKGADVDAIVAAVATPGRVVKATGWESLEKLGDRWFVKRTSRRRAVDFWRNAHGLAMRGVGAPKLFACGGAWVVGEWVEGPHLMDFVRERVPSMGRSERDAFLFRLARMIRRMHARGAYHRDLKGGNVVVGPDAGFYLVDLDAVRFRREVSERRRVFNLAQLNASLPAPLTRADRLRFLRWYAGRESGVWRRRAEWVRRVMKITVDRKHQWP